MESAAQGAPAGIRSLVIPGGVVRVVIRKGHAQYAPLSTTAEPILDALSSRLSEAKEQSGTLVARFPTGPGEPHLFDERRLRAPSVLDAIRALVGIVKDKDARGTPSPGVYGAFSHELVDQWEELPGRAPDPFHEPDASFVLALDAVYFDHLRGEVQVITRSITNADDPEAAARHDRYCEALLAENETSRMDVSEPTCAEKAAEPDVTDEAYVASAERFLHHIRAGDIFQGVLSRGLSMRSHASPLAVYRQLRRRNPSPYMFYLDLGDGALLGASPETCIKVEEGQLEIRPIAGTAPRGIRPDGTLDQDLDGRLAIRLLLDDKEQSEHVMLVDLARNDVARVCVPGTRRVTDPFFIERYSHVQHLVSRVRGTLRPGLDALHAYRASANMGTLTGAPKLRATELIRENEPHSRGFYGGAVGYLLQDGTFDSCIVIRSTRYKDGAFLTRAGAGIVADSIPERELAETHHKARACLLAVAMAEKEPSECSAAEASHEARAER
jgi:anthranilate synthase component 1